VGNLIQFGQRRPHVNVNKLVEQTKQPLFWIYLGLRSVLFLNRMETLNCLKENGRTLSSRPKNFSNLFNLATENGSSVAFAPDNKRWRTFRKLFFTSTFGPKAMRERANSVVQQQTAHFVSDLKKNYVDTEWDCAAHWKLFSMNVITNLAFSVTFPSVNDSEFIRLHTAIDRLMSLVAAGDPADVFPFLLSVPLVNRAIYRNHAAVGDASKTMIAYLDEQYEKQYNLYLDGVSNQNFIHSLIRAQKKWAKNEDQLEWINKKYALYALQDLFAAGLDTSSTTLSWMVYFLSRHPQWQEKIFQEVRSLKVITAVDRQSCPITEAVIAEVSRLRPPAPFSLPHEASVDTPVKWKDPDSGVQRSAMIPKSTVIIPNIYAACRDRKVFGDNPNTFNPQRFLDDPDMPKGVQFSVGPRKCIGYPLAQVELFMATAHLMKSFKVALLSKNVPIDEGEFGLTIQPSSFKVHLIERTKK